VEFVIESWARSDDRPSDLLYGHLRMAKEVQLHMWTSVLEGVVELADGRMDGGIRVITRRVDVDAGARASRRGSRRALADLPGRRVNFDALKSASARRRPGDTSTT